MPSVAITTTAVVVLAHFIADQRAGRCAADGAQGAAEDGIANQATGHGTYTGTDLRIAGRDAQPAIPRVAALAKVMTKMRMFFMTVYPFQR